MNELAAAHFRGNKDGGYDYMQGDKIIFCFVFSCSFPLKMTNIPNLFSLKCDAASCAHVQMVPVSMNLVLSSHVE